MWRIDMTNGLSTANVSSAVKVIGGNPAPLFIAKTPGGDIQPITTSPQVMAGYIKGKMVVFGTGKFIEPTDSANTDIQSIYGVWDNFSSAPADYQVQRNKLYERTLVVGTSSTTLSGSDTFIFGDGSTGTYRGWFVNLPASRERVAVESSKRGDLVAFNTTIPEGECSGDGSGRTICVTSLYGLAGCNIALSQSGLLSRPNFIDIEDPSAADSYTPRNATGRRFTSTKGAVLSTGTKIKDGVVSSTSTAVTGTAIPAGRMGWREVRNFRAN